MSHRRLRGDDGAATTELVIVAPAFIFFALLIIQVGLWFHAISVASTAAQEGAHDASLLGATPAQGEATARDLLDAVAPRLLTATNVQGTLVDGGDRVRMTVSGDVPSVVAIPGLDLSLRVNETAETPVEQFRPGGAVAP
jgi:Flp pilus assembly protein TadG